MSVQTSTPLLRAEWRDLVVLNFEIDPQILSARLPAGTELDLWQDKAYVSVVAFHFCDTTILGIPMPYHSNFEEINLRFYVRRKVDGEWRRGVSFVKELVPRRIIATAARFLYNENYYSVTMNHVTDLTAAGGRISYSWSEVGITHEINAQVGGGLIELQSGSEAEFILEHYWGYTRQRNGKTLEYRVEHPRWQVWKQAQAETKCNFGKVYGKEFAETLAKSPTSVIVAAGSPVAVYRGELVA